MFYNMQDDIMDDMQDNIMVILGRLHENQKPE